MSKGLNNYQLVKVYKEARKLFREAQEGTQEEITRENIYNSLWSEISNRNLDLRDYK